MAVSYVKGSKPYSKKMGGGGEGNFLRSWATINFSNPSALDEVSYI